MATQTSTGPSTSLSNLSLSQYAKTNHIDLTLDEDDSAAESYGRLPKRQCTDENSVRHAPFSSGAFPARNQFQSTSSPTLSSGSASHTYSRQTPQTAPPQSTVFQLPPIYPHNSQPSIASGTYRPVFAGPSSSSAFFGPTKQRSAVTPIPTFSPSSPHGVNRPNRENSERQVIDLTGSPSPPPAGQTTPSPLPDDLPPKTPVCIGQLLVTALVLYPVPYLLPQEPGSNEPEWATVRLQYEHNPHKPGGSETIHIKSPHGRGSTGEVISGEDFGVVEQKVATSLGPMLGKGLIRLDAKVRRGQPNLPILPLQMLVYTPKGNIPVVGNYLHQCGLFLDHPTPPYDTQRFANYHYFNPHNPPPGGHNRAIFGATRLCYGPGNNVGRWSTPAISGKSVEVQRSQVDELFKSLKSGEELAETEPCFEVATKLYPHQKKALTFLLEREREKLGPDGTYSSLWQQRSHPLSGQPSWFHLVTQKEVFDEPQECKGAILADDVCVLYAVKFLSIGVMNFHFRWVSGKLSHVFH
jgi:SWI/SNF-related matrix-associated actin-dependent regulator of chromatin subfamily A3